MRDYLPIDPPENARLHRIEKEAERIQEQIWRSARIELWLKINQGAWSWGWSVFLDADDYEPGESGWQHKYADAAEEARSHLEQLIVQQAEREATDTIDAGDWP